MIASSDIVLLTLVAALVVAFLVLAGLALSVRSFTVLTELIAQIGSLAAPLLRGDRQVQITSSHEPESEQSSAKKTVSRITLAPPDGDTTENGKTGTE